MKRVATLTFQNADNYGAMLQCFALQKAITTLGAECDVLNYKCDYLAKPHCFAALKRKGILRYFLGNVNRIVRLPRKKNFKLFRKQIKMSREYDSVSIVEANEEYDVFITGSDQVWNYQLTDFDQVFFLDFVQDEKKKMSYAASLGFDSFEKNIELKYKELLQNYSFINVRETGAKKMLAGIVDVPVNVVLDPTLLIEKNEWIKVSTDIKKKGYIFVYQLSPSRYMSELIGKLKRQTGLDIIAVPFVMGLTQANNVLNAGPSEWIGYIKNAEYVVTDSFHATVFSVLFNKKLYCCANESAGRMVDLLKMLELDCLLYNKGKNFDLVDTVSYDKAMDILKAKKEESISILKKMLFG